MPLAPLTSEKATELAKLRWQVCPTHAKPEPVIMAQDALNGLIREPYIAREIQSMLKIIDEQIESVRDELNAEPEGFCEHCKQGGAMSGAHRAALVRALDGLLERKTALLGIPGPGSLKPSSPRSTRQQAPMMPVAIPLPCVPDAPTSSVPPKV